MLSNELLAASILLALLTPASARELATPSMVVGEDIAVEAGPLDGHARVGTGGLFPALGGPAQCPQTTDWEFQVDISPEDLSEITQTMTGQGMRPVSVTAAGSIQTDVSFSVIWVRDELGQNNDWRLTHADVNGDPLDRDALETLIAEETECRVAAVDSYGSENDDTRYIAAWVCDSSSSSVALGLTEEDLDSRIAEEDDNGFRPVWIDGHVRASLLNEQPTRFNAVWTDRAGESEMLIDLEESTQDEPRWQAKTDAGYRLLSLSQYWIPDPDAEDSDDVEIVRRYAGVWELVPDECGTLWEAHRSETPDTVRLRAAAQVHFARVAPQVTVASRAIALEPDQVPGAATVIQSDAAEQAGITDIQLDAILIDGATPNDRDLLFLQGQPGRRLLVFDATHVNNGNLDLRRWNEGSSVSDAEVDENCVLFSGGCVGQTAELTTWQSRLALQFNEATNRWREVLRDGLSPTLLMPVSADATTSRLSTVWLARRQVDAQNQFRRFITTDAVTQERLDAASAFNQARHRALGDIDDAVEAFMRRRGISNAVLAISQNGRMVYNKGFTYAAVAEIEQRVTVPDALFRVASISKPITSVAALKLAELGLLDLDSPLSAIPGLLERLGDPPDPRIATITPRQLLAHLGGWDRDISPDFTIGKDFSVCGSDDGVLPVDMDRLLIWASSTPLDHDPGTVYAYSNWGFTILGRIIEAISGQTYADFLRNQILLLLASPTRLSRPPAAVAILAARCPTI